ncbi:MAG: lysophospholipid acyltransferase family protein [Desulfobacterales bacterium]|nr:lysophospholipid acyltransferase family protein [Desulfobacterales bacterium]
MEDHKHNTISENSTPLLPYRKGLRARVAQMPTDRLLFYGKLLGHLLYVFAIPQRRIVRRNLTFAQIPLQMAQSPSMSKRIFQHFGLTLIELVQMICLSQQELASKVRFENEDILIEALAKQKGVVLITAHLGNYEMGAQALPCLLGVKMTSVAKRMRNDRLNRLIHHLRTRFGNRVIYKKGALPEMMQTLRQGRMVAILMDISRRFDGVEVNFFDRRATATPSAALLGLRCKSPIVPAFSHRNPDGKLIVRVEPPVELQRTKDLRSDLQTNTQLITDRVEDAIRQYPEQWNWMLKRWKEFYPNLYPESERRLRRIKQKEDRKIKAA